MAGISTRTLRYYDGMGLLNPQRINDSGYRIYAEAEVERLQQILFYRELGVPLGEIKSILDSSGFDGLEALKGHLAKLHSRKRDLNKLIINIEKTIEMKEGKIMMMDNEKFEGFKKELIEQNETKYGQEMRQRYGNEAVDRSNKKIKGMTKGEYAAAQKLSEDVNAAIKKAFESGNPKGDLALHACELHKQWLALYWDNYSKEAHMALAQMYVDDPRFRAYYDGIMLGCAEFLRDAMREYTGIKE